MLDQVEDEIVDTRVFERARAELGSAFLRILGYFREDGVKAVDRIEHAMRTGDSASLVLPAHTLKGEARHFGALSLGDLAETIEMGARRCVDHQETPEELLVPVARIRESTFRCGFIQTAWLVLAPVRPSDKPVRVSPSEVLALSE